MPLRQTIGISVALLMASTGAMAQPPEKSTSYHAISPPKAEPDKSDDRSANTRAASRLTHFRWPSRLVFHRSGRSRYRHAASQGADGRGASPDPRWGPMHTTGYREIGQAAWYGLVGNRTSSGETLDTMTLTAAHRTLPLGSCARVTDLDSGRSVIVKINDRGPFTRRFIIDLSPRAADELGMRHAGVAAVVVEPVAAGAVVAGAVVAGAAADTAAHSSVAVYRAPGADVTQ